MKLRSTNVLLTGTLVASLLGCAEERPGSPEVRISVEPYRGPHRSTLELQVPLQGGILRGSAEARHLLQVLEEVWQFGIPASQLATAASQALMVPPFHRGDPSGDGQIDLQDLILLVNILLERVSPSAEQAQAADLNRDRAINVTDVIGLVNLLLQRDASQAIASNPNPEGSVFVSGFPGMAAGSDSTVIRNSRTGEQVLTPIVADGGFNPTRIGGQVDDWLEVEARSAAGTPTGPFNLFVKVRVPPRVVRTSPRRGGVDVPLNPIIIITYSEPMDPSKYNDSTVLMVGPEGDVDRRVELSPDQVNGIIQPKAPLAPSTTYVVRVTTEVRDLDGDPLEQEFILTFTTVSQ